LLFAILTALADFLLARVRCDAILGVDRIRCHLAFSFVPRAAVMTSITQVSVRINSILLGSRDLVRRLGHRRAGRHGCFGSDTNGKLPPNGTFGFGSLPLVKPFIP
jgi:hypothetical protein